MHHEILLLALPIAVSFLVPLLARRSAAVARWIAFLAYLAALAYTLALFPSVMASARAVIVAGWLPPLGIALFLSPLSLGAVALVYLIAALTALYNLSSPGENKRPEGGRSARGVALQALFVLGGVGMVLTADLFNAFVFLEIAGISAFALVASGRPLQSGRAAAANVPVTSVEKKSAAAADSKTASAEPPAEAAPSAVSTSGSLRYLVAAQTASLFMLLGIGLLYSATGLLTLPSLVSHPALKSSFGLLTALLLLFPVLLETKIVPLNFWVGRAYAGAPAGFAASLSGIGATAAAVLLLRMLSVMGSGSAFAGTAGELRGVLLLLGSLTVLVGETAAFREADLKKVLAWSSAGQMGVVLVGAALPAGEAAAWVLFFLASHAVAKALLFLLAGFFAARAGTNRWKAMKGLGRLHPLAAGMFTVGALSLMGLPLFAGFWGKLGVLRAVFSSGGPAVLAAAAILLGTVAEGVYFLRIAHSLFEAPEAESGTPEAEREAPTVGSGKPARAPVPAGVLLPALILAAAVLLLGLRPSLAMRVIAPAARELVSPDEQYAQKILPSGASR